MLTAALTGLRKGEIRGSCWGDFGRQNTERPPFDLEQRGERAKDESEQSSYSCCEATGRCLRKSQATHGQTGTAESADLPSRKREDSTALKAEQESMSDIFAGALGLYKNASSHGTGVVNDPHEAAELLVLASHLLKIVERRAAP